MLFAVLPEHEWIFHLFALGTIWFWLLLAALSAFLFYCTETDSGILAVLGIAATIALLYFLGGIDFVSFVLRHPLECFGLIAAYFVVGTGWSVAKWWFYVRDQLWRFKEIRRDYCRKNHFSEAAPIPEENKTDFKYALQREHVDVKPEVGDHKTKIYLWITYWPWSAAWTLLNDPIRKLVRHIYYTIRDQLQKISDYVWQGTEVDLPANR